MSQRGISHVKPVCRKPASPIQRFRYNTWRVRRTVRQRAALQYTAGGHLPLWLSFPMTINVMSVGMDSKILTLYSQNVPL